MIEAVLLRLLVDRLPMVLAEASMSSTADTEEIDRRGTEPRCS